jgi:hypothetical protein
LLLVVLLLKKHCQVFLLCPRSSPVPIPCPFAISLLLLGAFKSFIF